MLKRWLVLLLALACFAAALPALAEDDWEDEDDDYDWYDEEDDSDWYDDNYETEEDYWEDTGDDYDSDHSSHSSNNTPQYTAHEEYTVTVHVPPEPGNQLRVGDLLLQWEGFSVQLLGTGISGDAGDAPGLGLYCRFINGTSRTLYLRVADATLNDVPMQGLGASGIRPNTDSGEASPEYLLLLPMEGDAGEGAAAVNLPREARFTLFLLDESTFETLSSAVVTLALDDANA